MSVFLPIVRYVFFPSALKWSPLSSFAGVPDCQHDPRNYHFEEKVTAHFRVLYMDVMFHTGHLCGLGTFLFPQWVKGCSSPSAFPWVLSLRFMGNDDFPKAAEQASGSPCGFLWGQTALVTIGSSVPCQPMKAVDTKYTMQYNHH